MKVTPTRYEIEHNGFSTVASHYGGGWSIICRPNEAPNIPPYHMVLTIDGWKPSLGNAAELKRFDSIEDVVTYLEDYS